jgi:hypothetical protein
MNHCLNLADPTGIKKGTTMQKLLPLIGLLSLFSLGANAADVEAQTCEQIRGQIETITGLVPKADTELLQKLSMRQECRFSAAEAYRAAYGDKPAPPEQDYHHRRASHDEDDD